MYVNPWVSIVQTIRQQTTTMPALADFCLRYIMRSGFPLKAAKVQQMSASLNKANQATRRTGATLRSDLKIAPG